MNSQQLALHTIKEAAGAVSPETTMLSSAMLCLAEATELYTRERYVDARKRALDSLEYSKGRGPYHDPCHSATAYHSIQQETTQ